MADCRPPPPPQNGSSLNYDLRMAVCNQKHYQETLDPPCLLVLTAISGFQKAAPYRIGSSLSETAEHLLRVYHAKLWDKIS